MKFKKKKNILLFSFLVLWLFAMYFAYEKYMDISSEDEKNSYILVDENTKLQDEFIKENEELEDLREEIKKEQDLSIVQEEEKLKAEISDDLLDYLTNQEEGAPKDSENNPTEEIQIEEKKDINLADAERENFFEIEEQEECGIFECYSSQEFLDLYDSFEKSQGENYKEVELFSNKEIDSYIENIAISRGYKKRIFADENNLVPYNGLRTLAGLRDSYVQMMEEMKKENISLHFVSAYRDIESQKTIFKNKLGEVVSSEIPKGKYDEKIMEVLNISALPGYSKHHSGYAVDFGCGANYLVYQFADTPCYAWMSKNNFENTKRFGFIPSYPNGVIDQGPNPEPWEYVWVGVENIKKAKL